MTFSSIIHHDYIRQKVFIIIFILSLTIRVPTGNKNRNDKNASHDNQNHQILFVTSFHYIVRQSDAVLLQTKRRNHFSLNWNDVTQPAFLTSSHITKSASNILCFAQRRQPNQQKNTSRRKVLDKNSVLVNPNVTLVSSTPTLDASDNFLDQDTSDESWNEDFTVDSIDDSIPNIIVDNDDDDNHIPPSFYDEPETPTIFDDNEDEEDGENDDSVPKRIQLNTRISSSNNNETSWLEQATADILDRDQYPIGTLTEDDMDVICGLMASWPRRKSLQAAIQVEHLLKRIIDDMKDGNPYAHVTSRMYTYAIDAWAKSGVAGSAHRAQHIHDSMVRMYDETNDPLLAPSVVSYNALINAWGKCHPTDSHLATEQAEKVLAEMLDAMNQRNNTQSKTTQWTSIPAELESDSEYEMQSYDNNPYMEANQYYKDDVVLINGVICNVNNYNIEAWNQLKPDAITFSTLLDTYAKQSGSGENENNREKCIAAVERCEELFTMMDTLHLKKNAYTYSALQNVYARSGLPNAPNKTLNVLHEMISLYQQGDVYAKPNAINYNAVLNALSRNPTRENAKLAIEMLQKMELPVEQGGYDVEPDRLSYAVTILACARCPDEIFAAKAAEQNLLRMEERAKFEAKRRSELSSAAPPSVTLDVECFNVVLTAISRCRQRDAPDRAIRLINRMDQYVRDGQEAVRPNIRSWNAVLNAFARASGSSDDRDYAQQAEAILNRLISMHEKGIPNCKPDAFTYAAVLSAYQKSDDPSAAQRADQIVRRMEEQFESGEIEIAPDTYHYTILCGAWAKSNNKFAATRVLQILYHMKEREKAGYSDVKPNTRTYNAVLDCLSRTHEEERAEQLLYYMLARFKDGDEDAKPDSFSFNCVIQAFTRSPKKGSGKRAEGILDRLLEYHEEENSNVRPDARSFTHIIQYYARKCQDLDAMYRANYILSRMVNYFKAGLKDLAPSSYVTTAVLDSYSWRGHPDSGVNADRLLNLLRHLIKDYAVSKFVVNTAVMNSVLFAWSSCGDENAGRIAENYLDEMEKSYENGAAHLQPDSRTYGLVLSAWSKSSNSDKAPRALRILQRMERQCALGNTKVTVDEHAYSLVINTCAFSNSGSEVEQEAFDIALTVMDKVMTSKKQSPTSLTFGWFIQACGRLRVDEEQKSIQIQKAFLACCEAGLVNDFVLHRLKGAASETLYQTLMEPALRTRSGGLRQWVHISHLPHEWKRNVTRKKSKIMKKQ